MRVLVGCEESQVVTKAFREQGHEAYSCDIQETRGNPEWHFHKDVMEAIKGTYWDLIILHPDCSAMAVSGNRWSGKGMPKHQKRLEAIEWTKQLWNHACFWSERTCLENPVSVIFPELSAKTQYIQPWQFGHGETKKTGLALNNLVKLNPTNIVEGREQRIWKMPPGPNRKRDRSVTFQGIAEAMADQWGSL